MPLEQSYLEYLEEREKENTRFTPLYDAPGLEAIKAAPPQDLKNEFYDMLGSSAWAFGDEARMTSKHLCDSFIEGIETTAFGIGEIITSPFRADFYKPKKKTYYFKKPRLEFHYNSGRFYNN